MLAWWTLLPFRFLAISCTTRPDHRGRLCVVAFTVSRGSFQVTIRGRAAMPLCPDSSCCTVTDSQSMQAMVPSCCLVELKFRGSHHETILHISAPKSDTQGVLTCQMARSPWWTATLVHEITSCLRRRTGLSGRLHDVSGAFPLLAKPQQIRGIRKALSVLTLSTPGALCRDCVYSGKRLSHWRLLMRSLEPNSKKTVCIKFPCPPLCRMWFEFKHRP